MVRINKEATPVLFLRDTFFEISARYCPWKTETKTESEISRNGSKLTFQFLIDCKAQFHKRLQKSRSPTPGVLIIDMVDSGFF